MVSSAAALTLLIFKQLGMSFTYYRNNSGPRVEPWGTLHWMVSMFDCMFDSMFPNILGSVFKIALEPRIPYLYKV